MRPISNEKSSVGVKWIQMRNHKRNSDTAKASMLYRGNEEEEESHKHKTFTYTVIINNNNKS